MTRVIVVVAPQDRLFGVDFVWDATAAVAMTLATGARFVREVVTGVCGSDMGLWNTDPGALRRDRRRGVGEDLLGTSRCP